MHTRNDQDHFHCKAFHRKHVAVVPVQKKRFFVFRYTIYFLACICALVITGVTVYTYRPDERMKWQLVTTLLTTMLLVVYTP